MNKYTEEFLEECGETLVKADEIQNNKELMQELEPVMKEKSARMSKVSDLKSFWKQSLDTAVKKEDDELKDKQEKKLGEMSAKEESDDDKMDPLAKEKPKASAKA